MATEEFAFLKSKNSADSRNKNEIEFLIRKCFDDSTSLERIKVVSTAFSSLIQVEMLEMEIGIKQEMENGMDKSSGEVMLETGAETGVRNSVAEVQNENKNNVSAVCTKCKRKLLIVVDDGMAMVVTSLCCKVHVWHFEKNTDSKLDSLALDESTTFSKKPLDQVFKVDGSSDAPSSVDHILEMLEKKKKKSNPPPKTTSKKASKIPSTPVNSTTFSANVAHKDYLSIQPPALVDPAPIYRHKLLDLDWYYRPNDREAGYDDDDDEGEVELGNCKSVESSHEMELLRKYLSDSNLNTSGADFDQLMKLASKSDKIPSSFQEEQEEYEANPLKTTMSFSALINDDEWARESIIKYGGIPIWVHDIEHDELAGQMSCSCSRSRPAENTNSTRFVFQLLPYLWQIKFASLSLEAGAHIFNSSSVFATHDTAPLVPWTLDWSSIYIFQCLQCCSYFSITQSL